jgi:outer membrane protein assembly factor BamE (lipoprotein component of BamABCDE complex)
MVVTVACPHCRRQYSLADVRGDKPVRCPNCSNYFLVRAPAAPAAAASAARRAPQVPESPPAAPARREQDGRAAAADRAPRPASPPARAGVPVWVWLAGGGVLVSFLLLGCVAGGLVLRALAFRQTTPAEAQPAAALAPVAAKGPGGAAPGKLTAENFAKVQPGMTEAEVKALLGEPTRVSDFKELAPLIGKEAADDPNMRVLIWKRGQSQILITFLGGNVALSSANLPRERGERPAEAGGVTEENFGKLKYGMSQGEARQILGPPVLTRSAGILLEGGSSGTALLWRHGRDSIDARFDNDRLTSALGSFGGKTLQVDAPVPEGLPPWVRPGGQRLTRALADELKPGMDLQDVLIMLGPVGQELGPQPMANGKRSTNSLKYVDGKASLTLHFVDGKLAEKEENNLPGQ